jgi:hypothetical protein
MVTCKKCVCEEIEDREYFWRSSDGEYNVCNRPECEEE